MLRRSYALSCLGLSLALTDAAGAGLKIHPGVEMGMNYSTFAYDKQFPAWDRVSWESGVSLGFLAEIPLTSRMGLVSGLSYLRYRNQITLNDLTYELRDENNNLIGVETTSGYFAQAQNYLAVPIRLKLYPLPWREAFLSLGPQFGYLLSAQQGLRVESEEVFLDPPNTVINTDSSALNITDGIKRTNIALQIGVGVQMPLEEQGRVVIELRYTHGLTGIAKPSEWYSDWRTRSVELSLGLIW